ncbi:hypothetical protein HHI36_022055, partial [Cryptolaemus montrouzieri]
MKIFRKNKRWETPEVNALRDEVETARTIAMVHGDGESMGLYRVLKKRLKQAIEMKVRNIKYINEPENRSRAIWTVIYSKTKVKKKLKKKKIIEFVFEAFD